MDNCFIMKTPKKLNLPSECTFGVEVEFEKACIDDVEIMMDKAKTSKTISKEWKLVQDDSLYDYGRFDGFGGEAISPILSDKISSYKEIRNVCHMIKQLGGEVTKNCGGHIHIGANILDDNIKFYLRLIKLWTVYENEIIKFASGEDNIRNNLYYYAALSAPFFKKLSSLNEGNMTMTDFINNFGDAKKRAISFFNLNQNRPFKTIEIRCPNGTLNYEIWKNNINFFVKILYCCTNDSKNWDEIEKLFLSEERKITTYDESCKLISLTDFVFEKENEKNNFLIQYNKSNSKQYIK